MTESSYPSNYPFNDWHAAMAYAGADLMEALEKVIRTLQAVAQGSNEVATWAEKLGLPLVSGFLAFWQGRYREAAETLYPALFIANQFGGSHAQREIVRATITEAAIRGRLGSLAEAMVNSRKDIRHTRSL
ncbi:hypothetical protein [Marinobacter sp.]|uniref:hypothetical protein n=1 Tax=Marinobacter sp. TaxID=50741 RepID=UPI0034A1F525